MQEELNPLNTTRTLMPALRALVEAEHPQAVGALKKAARIGQVALLDGKKVLILNDCGTVADLSFSPEEAWDEYSAAVDGFITHEVDTDSLELVTQRSPVEAIEGFIEFGNSYASKFAVLHNLIIAMIALGEDVFEGFSEEATLQDAAVFYGNKLNFEEDDAERLIIEEMLGQQYGFDVRELNVCKGSSMLELMQ